MSSFDRVAFKALSGSSSIPFADEDVPGLLGSSDHFAEEVDDPEASKRGQDAFRSPLAKSCTESSLPSTRCAERLTLTKSRTDGYIPKMLNPLQRYENALLKYQKPKVPRRDGGDKTGCFGGYNSSSEDSVARHKSKSTSSIDARSVNNILDQYEELDCGRSSELSDPESVLLTDFEDVMRLGKVTGSTEVRKPTPKSNQSTQIPARPKEPVQTVNKEPAPRSRSTDVVPGRSFDPEQLLRKGEVQKRVDEWLSQTQSQNFRLAKEKTSLVRSNSSSCYCQKVHGNATGRHVRQESKETLNSALSCDHLHTEGKMNGASAEKTVPGSGRDFDREHLTRRSDQERQECGPMHRRARVGGQGASRIPQPGNSSKFPESRAQNPDGRVCSKPSREEGPRLFQEKTSGSIERANFATAERIAIGSVGRGSFSPRKTDSWVPDSSDVDRDRTRPIATPTRRSSLKRSRIVPSNGQATIPAPSQQFVSGATSPGVVGPSSTPEETTIPNKDRESRRPLVSQSRARGDEPATAGETTPTVASIERIAVTETNRGNDRSRNPEFSNRNDGNRSKSRGSSSSGSCRRIEEIYERLNVAFQESCEVQGQIQIDPRSLEKPRGKDSSTRMKTSNVHHQSLPDQKLPALPTKRQQPILQTRDANGNGNYVKCRIVNPVSTFKPDNAMYSRHDDDDEDQEIGFATSIGNRSVVRSHYATPKQIGKTRSRETVPVQELDLLPRSRIASGGGAQSPYGEKRKQANSSEFEAGIAFGSNQEDIYARVGDNRFYDPLETIVEDQRPEEVVHRRCGSLPDSGHFRTSGRPSETIYATPKPPRLQEKQLQEAGRKTFSTFKAPAQPALVRSLLPNAGPPPSTPSRREPARLANNFDANSLYESRSPRTVPVSSNAGGDKVSKTGSLVNGEAHPRGIASTDGYTSADGSSSAYRSASTDECASEDGRSSVPRGSASVLETGGVRSEVVGNPLVSRDNFNYNQIETKLEYERKKGALPEGGGAQAKVDDSSGSRIRAEEAARNQIDPRTGKERKESPVVNAVLMMTLHFEQEVPVPAPTKVESATENGALALNNFEPRRTSNRVYGVVRASDSPRANDDKVYVTKEEMEHQRLMELLKKGDFEAAKLELEHSYALSTPGAESPMCCPPCSPPPAPTAYISSARASSRRLGLGASSPERDPLGRLLRFLKTFYRELGTRDPPHLPSWVAPLPLGTLCPAHFQPHLQLVHKSEEEHRLENIKLDQIFAPVRLSDGTVSEAPRRVAVEGGPGSGRTTLCLRLLHQWATQIGDNGSPALAFIVPLRELRGSPLLNYLARELLPRTAALGDALAQVWRTLHLMEDRTLFVLDGYDECLGGRGSLGDCADLLEGRLFPEARILVTCSPKNWPALAPLVQRRVNLAGLEWPHVERLCAAYFIHNDIAERVRDFLELLNSLAQPVRQLGQHPLGWLMFCSLYQDSGSLPTETSVLIQAAVKCIVKRSLDPSVPCNEEIPAHCRKRLEDFGKLSLAALREGRCCYTEAELRSRGGGLEVTRLGFLTRGLTFGQRRKPDLYTPIHAAVAEFLAAYYMTSVAQYANILRRELEGLPAGIVGHLAGLLGPKTHLILNQLCPLEVPPRTVFSLLKAAGSSPGNVAAVCRLVGAGPAFGPAPNEPRSAPLVHTAPVELEGWARILESNACTLEALEIVFQVERGSDPRYFDDFFEALAGNESVKLVRITSLLGQEFPGDEAQGLARHLKSVLGKKRLNDFELVITCLEESAHDRLECVVGALCRGLSLASQQLARLVLDMNLSGEQVSRVCEALRSCVQVQALHLPHLGCGREGLASVAELLKERPLLALNLAGSWGAKNEDPSSSGISMGSGSGSGSSGCASSTLGTLPLNRCYSSLPRGAPTVYGSLTRPATLPRLPLGLGPVPMPNDRDTGSKRNSDSVLCHRLPLLHPLPTCDVASHQGTGFHEIFSAIREPTCQLRSLNVSKCLLGSLDAGCLGETVRQARHLDALRAAGASRPADMMPLVLALTEAPCLQLLDLTSPRLALDDHPSRLLCHALARNSTLKLLSLEGWTFRIEESDSLSVFSELLRCTSVRELSLCNARLHLAVHEGPLSRLGRRDDAGAELLRAASPPACPAIVFLRLAGFQVTVNDRLALRGPLLLPFLAGFTALSELDLSLDKSTIGGSSGSLLFIDDKILCHFFSCLSTHFRNLQSLRINFWRITLEDCDRTMRQISKYLKLCNLSFLKMNGLIVTDSVKKVQMEHSFLQAILTHLQYLNWLCLDGIDLTETQATSVGKCIRDRFPGSSLEVSAKDIGVKSVKALVSAAEDGGRTEVVYTGGSHCRLRLTKMQKNGKHKKK